MYNKDSDSLDTGAPDITITGNQRMASQPDPTAEMNDFSMKVFGKPLHQLTPPQLESLYELMNEQAKASKQNSGIMAAAPKGTYTQNRKNNMMAYGGIAGADGRRQYGLGSWFQEEIMDPIKGTADKLIPNELKNPGGAALAATLANYAPVMIPKGSDKTLIQQGMDKIGLGDYAQSNALDYLKNIVTDSIVPDQSHLPPDERDPNLNIPEELSPFRKALATVLPFGDEGYVEGGLYNKMFGALTDGGGGGGGNSNDPSLLRQAANIAVPLGVGKLAYDYQKKYLADQPEFPIDDTGITFKTAREYMEDPKQRFKPKLEDTQLAAQGGRIGYAMGGGKPHTSKEGIEAVLSRYQQGVAKLKAKYGSNWRNKMEELEDEGINMADVTHGNEYAQGGRIGAEEGGLMNLGGMEKDYRQEGGFVPIGGKEKADDVPARLSKNEFVFTADAVRAAGGGDIDKGASIMERLMENLEAGGKVSEDSQGLEGARGMFANAQQLEKRII